MYNEIGVEIWYTYMNPGKHTCIYRYTYRLIYVWLHIYLHIYIETYMHTCMHFWLYTYVYKYVTGFTIGQICVYLIFLFLVVNIFDLLIWQENPSLSDPYDIIHDIIYDSTSHPKTYKRQHTLFFGTQHGYPSVSTHQFGSGLCTDPQVNLLFFTLNLTTTAI